MEPEFKGHSAFRILEALARENAPADDVTEDFEVFVENVLPVRFPMSGPAGHVFVRRHGDEFDIRSEMAEASPGAAGMVPGSNQDHFAGVLFVENTGGELSVFLGSSGITFEMDLQFGDVVPGENFFAFEAIPGAGDEYAFCEPFLVERGGVSCPGNGYAAENNHGIGRSSGQEWLLDTQKIRSNKKGSAEYHNAAQERNANSFRPALHPLEGLTGEKRFGSSC